MSGLEQARKTRVFILGAGSGAPLAQGRFASQYSHYGHQGRWSERAPQYRRGDYLPYQFRQRPYYVNDWRVHRLYAPAHGYQWVQANNSGDYLLIAVTAGVIANLLINQ
jgi:Ni/Co efflux regulator RcnB